MTGMIEPLQPAEALVRLSHMVQHVFADVSRDHGLTPQQTQLLCRLVRGPVPMGTLATALHLERSGLSGLVDRVERRGLVERVRDPHDRRIWHAALTPPGQTTAEAAHQAIVTRLDTFLLDLAPDLRALLGPIVTTLLTAHTNSTGVPWLLPAPTP
ncbi:MarR family winged helix-turn-helix transcriptional regulator [Actinocorallia sp. A-T 12471]|uniref:MarR family winged helix-turn-helix transcriptional regulator n=1 Tax=Actinocorallia sp. A-T 12471 TaxID=3089813 RepID=UPI0029D2C692|nr:MarR family transcriptional regulator [Actinocorallia sp. A-T 12471]MDX6744242.1 MarR family transcriptional regulator [Actinocorallia sp. A-T 12471]